MDNNGDHVSYAKEVIDIEISSVKELISKIDGNFNYAVDEILKTKGRVVVCGIGKSGHIGKKIFATLVSTGTPSMFIHPAEAFHGDLGMVKPEDIFLALSNSGETEEIIKLIPFMRDNGNLLISLTGCSSSTLAKNSDYHIDVGVSEEACPLQLAPTSSTTSALVMGDALALSLMRARNFRPEDFARFHPGGALGRKLLSKVKDYLMPLVFVSEEDSVRIVISSLANSKCGIICIGNAVDLQGVITDGDIRKALDKKQDIRFFNLKAKELMSGKPKTIEFDVMCSDADMKMRSEGVNSLVVTKMGVAVGIYQNMNKGASK